MMPLQMSESALEGQVTTARLDKLLQPGVTETLFVKDGDYPMRPAGIWRSAGMEYAQGRFWRLEIGKQYTARGPDGIYLVGIADIEDKDAYWNVLVLILESPPNLTTLRPARILRA